MEPEPEPEAPLGPICVPALPYSGNFVVVTAATSPYADPGRFVEEGIQPDAEYLTNYPHLDVLTELNPRRFVVYKPVARAGPQPPGQVTSSSAPTAIKDLTMQVVTPNRHTETMIAIERALLRLHGTQRQSPHAIVGGLRMQSVTVKRGLPGAAGCHSPSGAVYTEVLQETHADTAPRATNVWMHVTHCAGKDIQFQTPAQKFGFDLADVRHHPSGEDRADIIAPGVPWVASDSDLSRPLDGPSRSAKFPAHSRRFLDHVKRNSDVVAEHTVMHGSIDLEPVSPRRIEAQRQLKETYSAGTAGTPPNLRLWDVKVHLDPQKAELSCSGYFMGTLIYRHCQHHLLELDYGAFAIAPADPGDMDACMWKLVERLDGEIAGLENKQVLLIPLDDTAGPFLQTGIHTWINMCRTEKASRVAAGALLRVTRDIWHDKRPSFQYGFVLAKPPSHHSLPNEHFVHYKGRYDVDGLPPSLRASLQAGQVLPSGYCHFNSVVCSVSWLLNLPTSTGSTGPAPHRPRKVVIWDIDVHLGDGSESAFWSNPDVLYVDFHEDSSDLTLSQDATLTGDPEYAPGSNLSVCVEDIDAAESTNTGPRAGAASVWKYKRAVRAAIPTVRRWMKQPRAGGQVPAPGADEAVDVIFFVSVGFDAMANDGFGTQHLNSTWFRWFTLTLRKSFPRVPMIWNLEGGYNPANVVAGMENILGALSEIEGSAEWERDYYT